MSVFRDKVRLNFKTNLTHPMGLVEQYLFNAVKWQEFRFKARFICSPFLLILLSFLVGVPSIIMLMANVSAIASIIIVLFWTTYITSFFIPRIMFHRNIKHAGRTLLNEGDVDKIALFKRCFENSGGVNLNYMYDRDRYSFQPWFSINHSDASSFELHESMSEPFASIVAATFCYEKFVNKGDSRYFLQYNGKYFTLESNA